MNLQGLSMSKIRRALVASIILSAGASGRLSAQTGSLADSAMTLVRAGLYDEATKLAIHGVAVTPSNDERCGLMFSVMYALTRQGEIDIAREQYRTYDQQCSPLESSAKYLTDLEILRVEWSMPPIPRTGFDFSSLDRFWSIVDTLSRNVEPSSHLWRSLLARPGYRLVLRGDQDLERQIDIAFRPSRQGERDSIVRTTGSDATVISHLIDAGNHRSELAAMQAALEKTLPDSIAAAVSNATRYLPEAATHRHLPPFVGFALFNSDSVAQDDGVVLDLLQIRNADLVRFLSRVFYRAYADAFAPDASPSNPIDASLYHAVRQLRNEGIADMLDKPYPLQAHGTVSATSATAYNAAYSRTPTVLRSLDSLLAEAYDRPADWRDFGTQAQTLLVDGSEPNGAYMAREVLDTFGRDSLVSAASNPFRFVRMYEAAEQKHGNPPPFSSKAIAMLDLMEKRWVKGPMSSRAK
jgi:hypothetical protein